MKKYTEIMNTPKVEGCKLDDNQPYFVKDFVDTLGDKFDLSTFTRNIKDIKYMEVNQSDFEYKYAGAEYGIINNSLKYRQENLDENIMHELLHIATRIKINDDIIVGFMQQQKGQPFIGEGINEGYTSLMDDRYFLDYAPNKKYQVNNVYPVSKFICYLLDSLLTREHMEKLYMSSNLKQLFLELSMLSSPRKTLNFLIDTDILANELDRNESIRSPLLCKIYSNVILYLAECFMTEFKLEYYKDYISKEEYERDMRYVKGIMNSRICIYKVIKSQKTSKYFNQVEAMVNKKFKKSRVK